MAQRPGFTISHVKSVDGGESPNAYVPRITVEIRVHYPPLQIHRVEEVLYAAFHETVTELRRRKHLATAAPAGDGLADRVRALADEAEANPSARYIHPSLLRALLAEDTATEDGAS